MEIIITYDVDKKRHSEVKSALQKKGFQDYFVKSNETYNLPNTTLWHPNLQTPHVAKTIFIEVIDELNKNQPSDKVIRKERFMAFGIAVFSGIPGDEHSE